MGLISPTTLTSCQGVPNNIKHIFVFSHPRTTSNLFLQFLAKSNEVSIIDNPFEAAYMTGPERMCRRNNVKINSILRKKEDYQTTYQDAFQEVQDAIQRIEAQGRIAMIKDPTYIIANPFVVAQNLKIPGRAVGIIPRCIDRQTDHFASKALTANPTVLPDSFMHAVHPVILIRHPALMVPSFYRISKEALGACTNDENFPVNVTFRWSRLVFDYYRNLNGDNGVQATVIDSSRMLKSPKETMGKFCAATGLDASQLQFHWNQALAEQKDQVSEGTLAFRRDFLLSTGIMKKCDIDSDPVLETELVKWKGEFGDEIASVLAQYVTATMEDYEYLRQFAL